MTDKKKTKINNEIEFRKFVMQNFNEEIEFRKFVVQGFTKVDQRFEGIDRRFDVSDKKFNNLVNEVVIIKSEITEIKSEMVTKKEFNNLSTAVDAYAHKADSFFQEMVMMSHDFKRHERWIIELAKKARVALEY